VKNLSVRYWGASDYALKNISFTARPGELVLIAGPSGSGKTTLAHTIAGFIPFFYKADVLGEVLIFGKNPVKEGIKALLGLVSFVGQDPEMFTTSLTVFEEIALPLINLGYPKDLILKRVHEISRMLRIDNLLNKLITELSAGQLQKVSLASALAIDPKVLVLDEPLARLDKLTAKSVSILLRKIVENDKIVLVFEHHLDEVLPLADKVLVLKNGKKVCEGKPHDVIHYLRDVDVPEISESFLLAGFDNPPLTVDEAVKYYDSIKKRMV